MPSRLTAGFPHLWKYSAGAFSLIDLANPHIPQISCRYGNPTGIFLRVGAYMGREELPTILVDAEGTNGC